MSETIVKQGADLALKTPPQSPTPPSLPEEPLVIIEPKRAGVGLGLRETWAYRELLYFLAWRDVKVRYKQTALGVVWVVMQPLLMTVVFTAFLGVLARVPAYGLPYPLMVYAGLLPWTFFANSVMQGGVSIVGNSNLITKVYFPRLIIPAASVAGRLVDFAVAFVILFGMMAYYRVGPKPQLLVLPLLVVLTALLALGVGMLVAALNVRYRDVGVILPVAMQLWMFASPVLYETRLVRQAWPGLYRLYALNPLVGIVEGYRAALQGAPLDWGLLGSAAAFTTVTLVGAAYAFRNVEKSFADVI